MENQKPNLKEYQINVVEALFPNGEIIFYCCSMDKNDDGLYCAGKTPEESFIRFHNWKMEKINKNNL